MDGGRGSFGHDPDSGVSILGKQEHNKGKKNQEKNASMVFIFLLHITNPPFFMSIPAVTEQRPVYSMNSWSSAAEQYKQTLSLISL